MSTNQPFTEKASTAQITKAKFRFTSPLLLLLSLLSLILLSGCGTNGAVSIDAATPGLFNHYIIFPLSWLLHQLAAWFTGNYGLAIIAVDFSDPAAPLAAHVKPVQNPMEEPQQDGFDEAGA